MENEQPAQSSVETANASSYAASDSTDKAGEKLSPSDVIRRMFAPASHVPEPRSKHAIVVVTPAEMERAVTHIQIENLLSHAIEHLRQRGVKEGDKVVFYCENCPELTSTILACWMLKAMVALIDYRAERADVLAMSKKLGAKLLITSKKLFKNFPQDSKFFTKEGLEVLDVSSFEEHKDTEAKVQFDIEGLDLDRPAFAILTSGTTGTPKTSVHTLGSLAQNISDLAAVSGLQGNMTAVTPLPISHIFGLSVFLVTQILGVKTVLTELEPVGFVKAVHRHKPHLIAALPQFYGALLAAPDGAINVSDTELLLCGGAPLTVSLADKFEEKFGKQLNNGYGSTESKIVALNKGGPTLSVGKPIGGVQIDIVNERDEVLPEGKNGEVRITSSMMMNGYLNNDKETRKVLHHGRYYTGDIGRFEDGNLFVAGRKGDVIIVGGVVVQAAEIEEALRNNPEVKEVAVTSVPDRRLGQIVKASVILMDKKSAAKLKSSDLNERLEAQQQLQRRFKAFCKEHLLRYQCPMKWEFLGPDENLPKTLAGKVDKKAL